VIRVKTLKKLSLTGRNLIRVRWRWAGDGEVETAGEPNKPLTWGHWEEEYYQTAWQAELGVKRDPMRHKRPDGLLDFVPAVQLWRSLERAAREDGADPDMLEDMENGRWRALYSMEGRPGWLEVDRE
jgi:hypothetical protein